jgi:hypothetical protein
MSLEELWSLRCCSYEDYTIITAVAWNVWKHINALVFDSLDVGTPVDVLKMFIFGPFAALSPPPPLS